MPAMYAHDRFGQDVITKLSGTLEELVTVERVAFDLGLQGPDLLYYYQPLLPNSIQKIGGRVHNMSGGRFLTRCAKVQRRESNDQGLAYLMGSVCHYALDVACHPIVEHRCKAGDFVHTEIEMAFDRALMVRDGLDPLTVAIGGNLETDGSFETEEVIAAFYPPLTPDHIAEAIRSARVFQELMLPQNEAKRALLQGATFLTGPAKRSLRGHIMSKKPIAALQPTVQELAGAYTRALEETPAMLEEFLLAVYQKKQLGESFRLDYLGEKPQKSE